MKISYKFAVLITFFAVIFSGMADAYPTYPKPDDVLSEYKPDFTPSSKHRGTQNSKLYLQPGFDVTLLMNQETHFEWSVKNATHFVIKDDKGKKIFDKSIKKNNSLDITPAKLNLKAEQKYSWSIDGDINVFYFTILDTDSEKVLLDNLAEIDAQNISPEERVLKKAAYVQLLSEKYSDSLDLYWLSAQWLSEISPTDKNFESEKENLLEKCRKHLINEMK